jgi:hypothetical protein
MLVSLYILQLSTLEHAKQWNLRVRWDATKNSDESKRDLKR